MKKILYILIFTKFIQCNDPEIVTNMELSDGFGSQFQNLISTVIYCELNNKKFVYSPFKSMEHNYDNDIDFLKKKEQLINFIGHFELNAGNNASSHNTFKKFMDENIETCANSNSLKKIKKIFRENKNLGDYFKKDDFNICVHIRRFNCHDSRTQGTTVPDFIFLETINKLRVIYKDKRPIFHLHSQGSPELFKQFESEDIIFHLDESLENTFASMVLAEVLVVAPSSFSYAAGLVSDGTVYYIPFWHNPLPDWINIESLIAT